MAWWPDLGQVVVELRHMNHHDEADRLLDAVAAGATSTEILGAVGLILIGSGHLRSGFTRRNKASWDRVMADVNRAYPPNFRFNHWLARLDYDIKWPRSASERLAALAVLFLIVILSALVFH